MSFLRQVLSNLFARPATRRYPFTSREPIAGSRGRLVCDAEKCIYCGICSRRCPAMAIVVTKNPAKSWTLDPYKCIVCGYCQEACPKKCLSMAAEHRPPAEETAA